MDCIAVVRELCLDIDVNHSFQTHYTSGIRVHFRKLTDFCSRKLLCVLQTQNSPLNGENNGIQREIKILNSF